MSTENSFEDHKDKALSQIAVRRSFIGRLFCKIGWHQFTCKMQDCIDEFGFIPNDGRMPKVSKCSRCGKKYA
jgi:hypothetical protein